MSGLPREILDDGLVDAIDPGKVTHRVWVTDRDGLIDRPLSLPNSRPGLARLDALVGGGAGDVCDRGDRGAASGVGG